MNRLDDLCRSERYFTATLLPALLLRDGVDSVVAFVRWLADDLGFRARDRHGAPVPLLDAGATPDTFELVTELNVKRELAFYRRDLLPELSGRSDGDSGDPDRQSVPDLVVLLDDLLLVVEGKFFVKGQSAAQIDAQIELQRDELDLMTAYLGDRIGRVCHLFLGPTELELTCDGAFTWADVHAWAERRVGPDHYVTRRLHEAVERFTRENRGAAHTRNYARRLALPELRRLCAECGASFVVGFHGGEPALRATPPQALATRAGGYKVDWLDAPTGTKKPSNWIRGDRFLALLDELTG